MVKFDSNRTYGIEIEMHWGRQQRPDASVVRDALRAAGLRATAPGYSHETRPSWKVVPDGSIGNGWELVSPILHGLDGREQLKTAMRAVKEIGATTSRSCGIHVHHGVHDFTAKELANIAEIYRNNEEVIDSLVAPSRRANGNMYTQSMDNGTDYHGAASERPYTRLEIPWNPPRSRASILSGQNEAHPSDILKSDLIAKLAPFGRYYKVNLESYLRQGTVEFRQYHSSLNANKIWAWVVFTQMIVSAAKAKRGKAKRRVVNTGNHLTAKERGMILDLGMHNFIDPWSGAENFDDITMSALRLLATRKPGSVTGFAHPVRFGGGATGDRQRAGDEEPEASIPREEFFESTGATAEIEAYEPPPVSRADPDAYEGNDDRLWDADEDTRPLPTMTQVVRAEFDWTHGDCGCSESIEEAYRTGFAVGDVRFGHLSGVAEGCPIYDQAVMYREEEIRAEETDYDQAPPEGQPGASLPTAQEIHNSQMDNGDPLPW